MRKTDLKFILSSPLLWPDLTTTKRTGDGRKLFHGSYIISALMSLSGKEKSPCSYTSEVADVIVVAHIFNRAVVEKTISPCPSLSPERRRR
jgi:hypothetical protein